MNGGNFSNFWGFFWPANGGSLGAGRDGLTDDAIGSYITV